MVSVPSPVPSVPPLVGVGTKQRLKWWAQAFMIRGVQTPFATMASAPTFTKGLNTVSSVNTAYVNNSVQFNGQSPALSWLGGPYTDVTDISIPTKADQTITLSDNSKTASSFSRVRFQTDAEAIDFNFVEGFGIQFNAIVDGQIARRSNPFGFANSGNIRWVRLDFGANVKSWSRSASPVAPSAGGSGYVVDEVVTLDGGGGSAGGTPAKVRVTSVSGGVVTFLSLEDPGAYTSQPTGNFAQSSTTGTGTGLTVGTSLLNVRNSTRKMRTIEALFAGGTPRMLGLVIPTGGPTILPAQATPYVPRVLFVGDSITQGTYRFYAGAGPGQIIAQMLGLWDNFSIQAQGGTGWNQDNGTALRWSDSRRIANMIAAAPDIIVFLGSQNDAAGTPLEDAIAATLTALQAALPSTLFVGVGNIMGDSTALAASIANGWARAPDQTRARFNNNHSPLKWIPSAYISDWQALGDTNHPHDDAVTRWASLAATQIGASLFDMTSAL